MLLLSSKQTDKSNRCNPLRAPASSTCTSSRRRAIGGDVSAYDDGLAGRELIEICESDITEIVDVPLE